MQLRARLAAIAALTPPDTRLADIGTDHAFLPVYLVQSGLVKRVIATDVHIGPYRSALETVATVNLSEQISVRLGDGLAVLEPGEVDTLVVAGMGGNSILSILQAYPAVTGVLSKLILQPMVAAGTVRRWLVANGWCIVAEELVREEGILYQIIAAEPGSMVVEDAILYDIGPLLWEKRPLLLKSHVEQLIMQSRRVLEAMSMSSVGSKTLKYQEFAWRLNQLEEKKACL